MTSKTPPPAMAHETDRSSPTAEKPLLKVLGGDRVWPPPIWLMRQAGRFLPEFRAQREKASFLTRCLTPDIAAELTLQPIHRFAMDGAILFSDILILPHAMGQPLDFVENKGPILDPLRDFNSLKKLSVNRVDEFIAPILQTLKQVRAALPATTSLLGFAGSPFTVSCYMIDGQSSRDFSVTRSAMIENHEFYATLSETLTHATAAMLIKQIDAGAEAVMLFDSWAGLLPPSQFFQWVIDPTKRIVSIIRDARPHVKIIGFPRLSGVMASVYARETGIDALACDTSANLTILAAQVPENMALQGNLDPLILHAGGDLMRKEASTICMSMRKRPHIFNLGHGVLPTTPPEHVADLVSTIRALE